MNFTQFKNQFFELACFNTSQVFAWDPVFDRNNLWRWTKRDQLVMLRRGFYTFPEYISKPGYVYFFANRMYRPSYISLHAALGYYGLIPETVVQITSVTSLKTAGFSNMIAEFNYKTIKPELMFGWDFKTLPDGRTFQLAKPEKAIADLLYLYPEYNTVDQILDLRFDDALLHDDLDKNLLISYVDRFSNKRLRDRAEKFLVTCKL